jgi:hypothetical protein
MSRDSRAFIFSASPVSPGSPKAVQVAADQGRAGRRLVVRGEGHAADLGGQRPQDRVLDPLADRDQRVLPAGADHGGEDGQGAGHDHRAQASSGPTARAPVRLKRGPIKIPVTARATSSTRATVIQTG